MISFPNSKINIGLNILSKRDDGYHNIETVFYPIPYKDILEIIPSERFELINLGNKIDCKLEANLCFKAYDILKADYELSPIKIILYKNVVFGSGLGSASSDAASTLILLNKMFQLDLNEEALLYYASKLGADCSFFIKNKPVFASGIGNLFKDIKLSLSGKYLILCLPYIRVNTANAYKKCVPYLAEKSLKNLIQDIAIEEWKNYISNDFEGIVFKEFPVLEDIKQEMYSKGAIYSQMSGSGSSIYGIFDSLPDINFQFCGRVKYFKFE